MGDATLPLGTNASSGLFDNPADLGRDQAFQAHPIDFTVYGDTGYFGLLNTSFYKATSLSGYLSTLQAKPGTYASQGLAVFPTFAYKGFAAGILLQSELGAQANSDGSLQYRSNYQFIPAAGYGVKLAGGIVRFGYSLQYVNEAVGNQTLPSTTSTLGYNQNLSEGSGFSHNLGFAMTLPMQYLPSFNVTARNVLGLHYFGKSIVPFSPSSTGLPPDEAMTVDTSFSMQPKISGGTVLNLVYEFRDLTNTSADTILGRSAIGMELAMSNHFSLRVGWKGGLPYLGGYPSAGIGLKRPQGEFSLTYYTEDLGTPGNSIGDTRFLMQYTVNAF